MKSISGVDIKYNNIVDTASGIPTSTVCSLNIINYRAFLANATETENRWLSLALKLLRSYWETYIQTSRSENRWTSSGWQWCQLCWLNDSHRYDVASIYVWYDKCVSVCPSVCVLSLIGGTMSTKKLGPIMPSVPSLQIALIAYPTSNISYYNI